MSLTVKASGSSAAQLVRTRTGYNRSSGPYIERTYEGTKSAIAGIQGSFGLAQDYYIEHDGPLWRIVARFARFDEGAETPVDDIRMESHRVLKSIYSHPNYSGIDADDIRAVRAAIADLSSGPPTLTDPAADELYSLLLAGVEHYPVYQDTLIKTRSASSQFAWTISYANVGNVISPGSIVADAQISGLLAWNLPNDPGDSIFAYGWLKHRPSVTTVAGNKRALVQEYEYGRWTTLLYTII